jgi:flagellar biosynthetic protein FliQ
MDHSIPIDLQLIDLARQMMVTVLLLAAPALLAGLCVGLAVSLFQSLTSIQEQTLSLVPKMVIVFVVALVLLSPALAVLREYTADLLARLNSFGLS